MAYITGFKADQQNISPLCAAMRMQTDKNITNGETVKFNAA